LPELEGALEPLFMPVVGALPGWFFMAVPRSPVVLPSIESPVRRLYGKKNAVLHVVISSQIASSKLGSFLQIDVAGVRMR
jgi:hypothetical protein